MSEPPNRWRWRKRMPERHGELFTVLARGKLNSCMIRFESDGWIVITSRNALRRVELQHPSPTAGRGLAQPRTEP